MAFLSFAYALTYCSQNTVEETQVQEENSTQSSQLRKDMSELSLFMRDMYDLHYTWKKEIEEHGKISTLPLEFDRLHSAVATNPGDLNETYTAMAEMYKSNIKELTQNPENPRELYNIAVGNCVSCHEIFCQGPIAKIKKLYLAE